MYWYEVLETKKKSGLTKITTWHFGKFSEEKCLKFHAEMDERKIPSTIRGCIEKISTRIK